jgi:hypothetical protein
MKYMIVLAVVLMVGATLHTKKRTWRVVCQDNHNIPVKGLELYLKNPMGKRLIATTNVEGFAILETGLLDTTGGTLSDYHTWDGCILTVIDPTTKYRNFSQVWNRDGNTDHKPSEILYLDMKLQMPIPISAAEY